jgi:putative ABC transport system ATP-binding protein
VTENDVLLSVTGIDKAYGSDENRVLVLDGVDVSIATGEFVAIAGRSGSGKSTLLNIMAGLETPDNGCVSFRGRLLHSLSDREMSAVRRTHFGFVFQSFNLIPTLTTIENLVLPLSLAGRLRSESRSQLAGLLADVGLAGTENRYPEELSGGEQQRLAVARAVAHEPELVFADEPTGNLDIETARQTLALLERFTVACGRTLVMATHSAEMIAGADRVLSIEGGRLGPAPGRASE